MENSKKLLLKKIEDRSARIAIVGVGYVGFPLAVSAANSGFSVLGLDINASRVSNLNRGKFDSPDVTEEEFGRARSEGRLTFSASMADVGNADVAVICVPTPLDSWLQPDLSPVRAAAEEIAKHRKNPMLVVLQSTTYPGTTEEVVRPILCPDVSELGIDLFLAYSPERVDPGNKQFQTGNTPKVVGGCTKSCSDLAYAFYKSVGKSEVFVTSSPQIAEMEKLLENTFRLVNISLVNELSLLCDRMGIDIWEVIEAAKTKPYGFMAFYPGPGPGGHCIPIDPYYLTWKAKEYRFSLGLIEKAEEIIHQMPEYVVSKAARILNEGRKSLNGSKIALLGITYKKDISDYRESPSVRVFEKLVAAGAEVRVVDPMVSEFRTHSGVAFPAEPLTTDVLTWADLAMIATDHTAFDGNLIMKNSKKIFDTRNMLREKAENIVRL